MSKIIILLCVPLFAAAVDAYFLNKILNSTEQSIERLVETEIAMIEWSKEVIQNKTQDLLDKCNAAANNFKIKFNEKVEKLKNEAINNIQKIINGGEDADIDECKKMIAEVDKTGIAVIVNVSGCIVDKKNEALTYIANTEKAVSNAVAKVTSIRDEVRRCAEKVQGFGSILNAIICSKLAALRGTWQATTNVPALVANVGRMMNLVATLKSSLPTCMTARAIDTLQEQLQKIAKNIEMCVQQKIEEKLIQPTLVNDLVIDFTKDQKFNSEHKTNFELRPTHV